MLVGRSGALPDGTDFRINEFDASAFPRGGSPEQVRSFIETVTSTHNRDAMLRGNARGGALAFVIKSARDDSVMGATFEGLDRAARRQLTRTRAGMMLAGFDSISSQALQAVAGQDLDPAQPETALNRRVRSFFSNPSVDHVVTAAFISRGAIQVVSDTELDGEGAAYIFPNRQSRFWSDSFSHMFGAPGPLLA